MLDLTVYGRVMTDRSSGVEHERGAFEAFIRRDRRGRYLALLASARGRRKLVAMLAHCRDLNDAVRIEIPAAEQTAEGIARRLRALGAPDECHAVSELGEIDGRNLPLDEALRRTVGRGMGTIVSCIPGELGYYEGEERGERWILSRCREG